MCLKWSRHPLITAVALVVGWLAVACSDTLKVQSEPAAVGSAGHSPAVIAVETSSLFVTVENRAGQPLEDVKITLKPPSGVLFTTSIWRLETGAKRDLPLSDFRSSDGTSFSLRLQRPKQVLVTASDLVGKKHEVTVPWK
jgi:hypothetical protein